MGAGEDRVESSVIVEGTKGVDRSVKGRQEEDGGVGITSDGGVRQSSEVSKVRGRVDGLVEIPGEGRNRGKTRERYRGFERISR